MTDVPPTPPAPTPPTPAPTPPPEPAPAPTPPEPDNRAFAEMRRRAEQAERDAQAARDQLAQRERKEAEEQGRYKELAEAEKKRADELASKLAAGEQDRHLETVAKGLKFKDPDLAKHLLPANVDRNDTAAVKTALETVATERPHLVDNAPPPPPPPSGAPAGGPPPPAGTGLTREQIAAMSPDQVAKLDPAIVNAALAAP